MKLLKNSAPALVGSILFCLALAGMYLATVHGSHGMFVYPLDDSYIHLALSKTLAFHHVWGIGPADFGSASSSPGWTLLLTVFDLIFGSHILNALLLNVLCAIPLLFTLDYGLRCLRPDFSLRTRLLAQFAFIFLVPLPNLAFIGMEHVAQTLTILLVAIFAVRILTIEPGRPVPNSLAIPLLLSILFSGALRYEAVFAVIPIAFFLLIRRRVTLAVLFSLSAAVGPVVFGLYSHHLSGFWLPFSVLMKAQMEKEAIDPKLTRFFMPNSNGSFLQILFIPLLIWGLRARNRSFWNPTQLLLLLSFIITALHLALAPTRWLMRYESYFVALAIFAFITALPRWHTVRQATQFFTLATPQRKALVAMLLFVSLLLSPFLVLRVVKGLTGGPKSSIDRYHEHIQMARFIEQFYDHDTVVVNDIGAVAFYSDARLLDIYGLGSIEPIRTVKTTGHTMTRQNIQDWAASQNASIAILQPEPRWIHQRIPPAWIHVIDWRLPRNLMFGDKTVSIYAVQPSEVPRLCDNLHHFRLDPDVGTVSVDGACPATVSSVSLPH